jgi:hypothetical protein
MIVRNMACVCVNKCMHTYICMLSYISGTLLYTNICSFNMHIQNAHTCWQLDTGNGKTSDCSMSHS